MDLHLGGGGGRGKGKGGGGGKEGKENRQGSVRILREILSYL